MKQFLLETKETNIDTITNYTIINIILGLQNREVHDIWMDTEDKCYCLCKQEIDADGEKVYTAYQLWMAPETRGLDKVHSIIRFITFYAQKQGYKRLYIPSSRIDHIKAYARGLGNNFKIKTVTFTKEL